MHYSNHIVLSVFLVSLISGCGGSSGGGSSSSGGVTLMDLENFQPANVVIGQADFSGDEVNQGASRDANTLNAPYGSAAFASGVLYISDYSNDRVLGYNGIPQANNMPADFVLGQADFTASAEGNAADQMNGPQSPVVSGGKMVVADYNNERVLIFDPVPDNGPAAAAVVAGQSDFDLSQIACSETGMDSPETAFLASGKLIVTDSTNNRVLIWNSVPAANGEPADIVLGQNSFDTCVENDDDQDGIADAGPSARTLSYPAGVWSDGTRLVVLDGGNKRALIWNTFPDSDFEPADVVLGQADFTSDTASAASASTFEYPYIGVDSNGQQLAIADSGNNRVMVWDTFPAENNLPADVVIGQENFSNSTNNDDDQDGTDDGQPSARTLNRPAGLHITRDGVLIVSDRANNRLLVYEG